MQDSCGGDSCFNFLRFRSSCGPIGIIIVYTYTVVALRRNMRTNVKKSVKSIYEEKNGFFFSPIDLLLDNTTCSSLIAADTIIDNIRDTL